MSFSIDFLSERKDLTLHEFTVNAVFNIKTHISIVLHDKEACGSGLATIILAHDQAAKLLVELATAIAEGGES